MSNPITKDIKTVPKSDIEVLNQEIDEDEGQSRIRAGNRVHYVTIPGHASPNRIFDEDTLCRPYLLVPKLPPFPDVDWTKMSLSLGPDGSVQSDILFEPLDEWLVPQVEHETRVYEALAKLQGSDEARLTPEVLGHLFEGRRNMGLLLEKIEGDCATPADLPKCETALRKLHKLGFIHGDANRYNFIIERSTGNVKMIDFEHAEKYDEKKAKAEIEELASELTDESGRGAPATFMYH
ncbi:hypothetical protein FANTH_7991 [Fusarium anthophilum]|uniref:Protein kinase domain-containing protein n=1 Tax=Fusarium anthophilum TaxID=48485 RepID=A0A8H4ZCS6_9HYPO|nr:hypothetical protein FANTH_7991 [Fusarium anthophilum]